MSVTYAPSFIDALFERRDATALHTLISVRARHSPLPDECALFVRVLEWLGSDWQYYEALKEADFQEVCRLLDKFGMVDALTAFQMGRSTAEGSTDMKQWFSSNESQVLENLFMNAKRSSDFLKRNEG
jgi:hypothetical protein